jgi:hypothetical protein
MKTYTLKHSSNHSTMPSHHWVLEIFVHNSEGVQPNFTTPGADTPTSLKTPTYQYNTPNKISLVPNNQSPDDQLHVQGLGTQKSKSNLP